MAHSKMVEVRRIAVAQLSNNLAIFPDKEQAWNDLFVLAQDEDTDVRIRATIEFSYFVFPHMTDQAWKGLLDLVRYGDNFTQWHASKALGLAFPYLTDKAQATKNLLELTKNKDIRLQSSATTALGLAFPYITDKVQGTKDLLKLTKNKCHVVRSSATTALGLAFPYITDKVHGTKYLLKLTKDRYFIIQAAAAEALGLAYPYVSNKVQVMNDLLELTKDKEIDMRPYDDDVRMYANFSLGKLSIFKATQAKNNLNFREELENAIEFFEKSTNEDNLSNPARFCLPFYRSFYVVTFGKLEEKEDIQKYINEAKSAIGFSKSKEQLLKAIENLANALNQAQKARRMGLDAMKSDLNAHRIYIEDAIKLLNITQEKAPGATKLIKKGLPIIDARLKGILKEIQEKAIVLCEQTKGTPFQTLGKELYRQGKNFSLIRDPIGLGKGVNNLQIALFAICAKMPEEERGEACELLNRAANELYIEDKVALINMVLSKISSQISAAKNIEIIEKKLDEIMVCLKPGIYGELVITVGPEIPGLGGIKHEVHIPLKEISYPDLKKDLEKIKGRGIIKLISLPAKLAEKVKDYLTRNKKDELQVI